jgi:hypothetical protein
MRRRERHLREDRLFDCYLAARNGDAVDPPAADHLADCPACQARYADLTRMMDGLRESADAATDAVFGDEQLRGQRAQIARRLEQLGHAARIISFPGRPEFADEHARRVVAPRWLVASAAAGLLAGVALTSLYDLEYRQSTVASATAPAVAPAGMNPIDDDVLLLEIDDAIGRPRTRALEPFRTLTPSYREISATER